MNKIILLCICTLFFISCRNENEVRFYYEKALESYGEKDFCKTKEICEKIIYEKNDFFQCIFLKSKCHFFLGEYEEAEKLLLKLREKYPSNKEIYKLLNRTLISRKNFEMAETLFKNEMEKDPDDWRIYFEGALIFKAKKDFSSEMKYLIQAKNILKDSSPVYKELLFNWESLGIKDKADENERILRLLEENPEYLK